MNEIDRTELYEKSDSDIIAILGSRLKSYRIALRLTQQQVAEQSGVSVMTVARFERGEKNSIRMDNFIALLRAVQRLEGVLGLIPEIQPSLYAANSKLSKASVRVRRRGNER